MNANGVDTNIVAQVAKRQKPETALPLNDPPTVHDASAVSSGGTGRPLWAAVAMRSARVVESNQRAPGRGSRCQEGHAPPNGYGPLLATRDARVERGGSTEKSVMAVWSRVSRRRRPSACYRCATLVACPW